MADLQQATWTFPDEVPSPRAERIFRARAPQAATEIDDWEKAVAEYKAAYIDGYLKHYFV